jgi:hypothetical protein
MLSFFLSTPLSAPLELMQILVNILEPARGKWKYLTDFPQKEQSLHQPTVTDQLYNIDSCLRVHEADQG